jgi:NADH-quinone oxidoreductase subunit M
MIPLLLLAIPVSGVILLLFVSRQAVGMIRNIALTTALSGLAVFLALIPRFNPQGGLQELITIPWLPSWGLDLSLAIDGISFAFLALTAVLSVIGLLYSRHIENGVREFHILYLLLTAGAYGLFLSQNLFFIVFFLEFEVLTAYFLISLWKTEGSEKNAVQFVLFLTLAGLLLLVFLFLSLLTTGGKSLELASLKQLLALPGINRTALFIPLLISLLILCTLFPFHAWGPRGYMAADRGTNVLLAGILKQAGPYLVIRLLLGLFPEETRTLTPLLMSLALINILYVGWVAMAQKKPKLMIGYSSASHMGYVLLGILCFSKLGLSGAIFLTISHGLIMALLFGAFGRIEKEGGLFEFGQISGLGTKLPFLHFAFTFGAFAAIGLPGLASFAGEVMIFFALIENHKLPLALALAGLILSAVYLLRAVSHIFHGQPTPINPFTENLCGKWAGVLLILALLFLGTIPAPFLGTFSPAVEKALSPAAKQTHE